MTAGIGALVGHCKRACADEAGASSGAKYAGALLAQAAALRTAASMLETAGIRALLDLPKAVEPPA